LSTSDMSSMVLRQFFTNEKYMRKVVPFMEPDYFEGVNQIIFKEYVKYVVKYNGVPSLDSFTISLQDPDVPMSEEQFRHAMDMLPDLFTPDNETDEDWLLSNTEKWCQDRALFNAVMESISIIDGKHQTLSKNALPEILSKALGVTFDTNVGHDYTEDASARHDFYTRVEERVPFDIEKLNQITKGGLPNKSLNIILAGTGVGKSLFMCHCAAAALAQGKNVLYITMEMAEERIAERIDANLLDTSLDQIASLSKDAFLKKVDKIAAKTHGKLIIKEYPTSQAHAGHFRALLNELKLKKKFTPDLVFIDYLNICSSSRIKSMSGSVNSYTFIKSIAEELRGLAVEFNLPIMSATQTTRAGYGSSDPGLEDTSESFGLPATADLMLALVSNDELRALNQVMVKQLKNRYADPGASERFVVGVERSKMKLYDVEDQDQDLINGVAAGKTVGENVDVPLFDTTPSGKKISAEGFKM
jgi:archaellum biogenesis ATPase FlaH